MTTAQTPSSVKRPRRPLEEALKVARLNQWELQAQGEELGVADRIRCKLLSGQPMSAKDFDHAESGTVSSIAREMEVLGFNITKERQPRPEGGGFGPFTYQLLNPTHEPTPEQFEAARGVRSGHKPGTKAPRGGRRVGRPPGRNAKDKTKVTDSAYPKLPNVREQVMVTGVVLEANDQIVVLLRDGETTWKARLEGATQ